MAKATERPLSALVDEFGQVHAQLADLEAVKKNLAQQIISRADGQRVIEGVLFKVTIVSATTTTGYDTKKMEQELGESFLSRFIKWGTRAAYLLPQARTRARSAA